MLIIQVTVHNGIAMCHCFAAEIGSFFSSETKGVLLQLSGFVCAFHPAAPSLSPKHTIYAFINLYRGYFMCKSFIT